MKAKLTFAASRGGDQKNLNHFFLFDLVVNDMTRSKLLLYVLQTNPRLDHQYHNMIAKVGNFIDSLGLILGLSRDDDLGTLFAHLFQNLDRKSVV